jgi:hypothetical protein
MHYIYLTIPAQNMTDGWDSADIESAGFDEMASYASFCEQVQGALEKAYPGAEIEVDVSLHEINETLTHSFDSFEGEHINDIQEQVYSEMRWIVSGELS